MHDVAIVGAGPVGGTLALALADADLDVVALDARAPGATLRRDRFLALSHGARLVFERLGVWPRLAAADGALTPIRAIDISQAGGFGVTRLSAAEHGLPALGYVVSYVALQAAIDAELARTRTSIRYATEVAAVGGTPSYAAVTFADAARDALTARLAVVADGAGTAVAGVARERRPYRQVAVLAKVAMAQPHGGVAYERFTPAGPVALLPEGDHYGLIWTMPPAEGERALALPDAQFTAELRAHFGARVEGFRGVRDRATFPLALEFARPVAATRCVLIGNAAQTLHPIAGQGFNLGVRDAFALAQTIVEHGRDALGERAMVAAFVARRRLDRGAGIAFTHALTQLFAPDWPPLSWPRGVALAVLDAIPPLKRTFTDAMLYGLR